MDSKPNLPDFRLMQRCRRTLFAHVNKRDMPESITGPDLVDMGNLPYSSS